MDDTREDRILCQTPTSGKKGVRIDRWKYDLVSEAILGALPADDEGITFKSLPNLVEASLSGEDRRRLGSIGWYTTTVKLDLEVRGEIERIPGSNPQRLRRVR